MFRKQRRTKQRQSNDHVHAPERDDRTALKKEEWCAEGISARKINTFGPLRAEIWVACSCDEDAIMRETNDRQRWNGDYAYDGRPATCLRQLSLHHYDTHICYICCLAIRYADVWCRCMQVCVISIWTHPPSLSLFVESACKFRLITWIFACMNVKRAHSLMKTFVGQQFIFCLIWLKLITIIRIFYVNSSVPVYTIRFHIKRCIFKFLLFAFF